MTFMARIIARWCFSLTDLTDQKRLALIAESHLRLTGRPLVSPAWVSPGSDTIAAMWAAPQVILAHGTQDDPLFFYGNKQALKLFELTSEQLAAMPSRLSAEPLCREERANLLARVARDGFIDDYSGVRVSRTGKRFRIQQATVWDLIDETGVKYGQAATFANWEFL